MPAPGCAGARAARRRRHHVGARHAAGVARSRDRARSSTSRHPSTNRRSAPLPTTAAACRSCERRWRCTSRSAASGGRGGGYPASLLGTIAFVRQSFLDAQHQQLDAAALRAEQGRCRAARYDAVARRPAAGARAADAGRVRGARWRARSCVRLNMAREFKLDPVITGAREADQVTAGSEGQERARHLQPELPDEIADARA